MINFWVRKNNTYGNIVCNFLMIFFCFQILGHDRPIIIFLNGVSSAGKSSLAKNLQDLFKEPFLHLGIDTFGAMLPERFQGVGAYASLGWEFKSSADSAERPVIEIVTGCIGKKLLAGMQHSVGALANAGNNLIIDEVLLKQEDLESYRRILQGFRVYFIGVTAPLEIIEEREKLRGDRCLGLARGMYDIVHVNKIYDLVVDTSMYSPFDNACRIKQFIQDNELPTSFWR